MTTSTDTSIGGYVFHEGDRIRKAREVMELSQDELAERTSISRATISNYERGSSVKRSSRRLLAMSLGVTPEWLETGSLNTGQGRPEGLPSNVNSGCRNRRRHYPPIVPLITGFLTAAA